MPAPRIKQPLSMPFPFGIPNPVAVVVECNFSPATPVTATVSTTVNPDPTHASTSAAVPPPLIVGPPALAPIRITNPPPQQNYYVTAAAPGQGSDLEGPFRLTDVQEIGPRFLRRGGLLTRLAELLAGLFGYKRVPVGGPVTIANPGAVVVAAFRDVSIVNSPTNAFLGVKAKMVTPVAAGGSWATAFWLTGPAGAHYNFWIMEFDVEGLLKGMRNEYKAW